MKDLFIEEAGKNGWNVVEVFSNGPEDLDFRVILLRIKNLDNVDAIYAPLASNDPHTGLFMKQMKELGLNVTVISTASTESQGLLNNFGNVIEGIIYPFPVDAPTYTAFEEKFKEQYGELPKSPSAATAYDATRLLIDALHTSETPEGVAEYLHSVEEYQGASNVITFDQQGIVSNKADLVKTVKDGAFVEVSYS